MAVLSPKDHPGKKAWKKVDFDVGGPVALRPARRAIYSRATDQTVVNLTDRNNVCCVDDYLLTPNMDGTVEVEPELNYWLGITPTFSVLWEF